MGLYYSGGGSRFEDKQIAFILTPIFILVENPTLSAVRSGAGDCFSGTFAAAVAAGKPLEQAIHFALTGAAISITRPGAQSSLPTLREILRAQSG